MQQLLAICSACAWIVSSPDFIWHVYRFQYNPRAILKAIRARVGLGLGLRLVRDLVEGSAGC